MLVNASLVMLAGTSIRTANVSPPYQPVLQASNSTIKILVSVEMVTSGAKVMKIAFKILSASLLNVWLQQHKMTMETVWIQRALTVK